MEIVKLLLPLFTFCLGSMLTIYLGRRSQRNSMLTRSVDEICKLSEAWYNEALALSGSPNIKDNGSSDGREKLEAYYYASQFVSRYRRALEALRSFKKCNALVKISESFLVLLTEPRSVGGRERHVLVIDVDKIDSDSVVLKCRQLPLESIVNLSTTPLLSSEEDPLKFMAIDWQLMPVPGSPFLSELYGLVQAIHLEAARLER